MLLIAPFSTLIKLPSLFYY